MHVLQKIYEAAGNPAAPPALIYNLQSVSYRDLYRMIMRVRGMMAHRDLRLGGVALICVEPLIVAWAADLALRSLGLTTMAVRPDGEPAVFADLDVACLVTSGIETGPSAEAPLSADIPRIVLARNDWQVPPDDGAPLAPPPAIEAGVHIMLTSGTTGHHKMVRLEPPMEAMFAQMTREREKQLGLAPGRRAMVNLVDFGLWATPGYAGPIAVWSMGATVVLHQGADAWRSLFVPGLTNANMTPGMLSQLLASAPPDMPRNDALELTVTGAQISVALANYVKARLTHRLFSNLGATEGGAWATTTLETVDDIRWHRILPGRVVEVVDDTDQPLALGELGQVRVRLDNGFTGYVNDPDASARHVREGWFYPGDLGVLDGKGRLALYGRATDILNIMGDKVPAAPFEEALRDALGIEGVCVFSEPDGNGLEQLHVVLETATPIDAATLEAAAQANLSGFPKAHFHFMEALPRTGTGKIQRFKLKQLMVERRRRHESDQTATATGRPGSQATP